MASKSSVQRRHEASEAREALTLNVRHAVPLAPLTSLELGGPADHLIEADDTSTVRDALRWAAERHIPATVLGGGSNVVVADGGFPGLVLRMAQRGTRVVRTSAGKVELTVQAGEPWDPLVAWTVREGWAGFECLSGIPGLTGATPIQNVGAYGQEVSETIRRVQVLDRRTFEVVDLSPTRCGFAYRDSSFKRDPDRWVVLEVTFELRQDGDPTVRYAELARALDVHERAPTLAGVRSTVLQLRRGKSMVIDPVDENRRSAGSFFTNPILPTADAASVVARAVELGDAADPSEVPSYPAGPGLTKIAAAWLIERAGVVKGTRVGAVGTSSRHALALVHHGGGRTQDLIRFARQIRDQVEDRFGVRLSPEPVFVGFDGSPL